MNHFMVRNLVAAALRYGSWTLILDDPDGLPQDVIAAVADFVTLRPQASDDPAQAVAPGQLAYA